MDKLNVAQNQFWCMGTLISQKIFGPNAYDTMKASEAEIRMLNHMLSRFISDSDIAKINDLAGLGYIKVNDETFELLEYAIECSKICNGYFDITIGSIVMLWDEYKRKKISPVKIEIQKILSKVNIQNILLNHHESSVLLKQKGQSIDLGGIAKGFTSDKVLEVYRKMDIKSAYINLGGNVAVIGSRPDCTPWNIGIQHPRNKDLIIGVLSIENKSVVTSGDYQRYYKDDDGVFYHHILNPLTGFPAHSGLISVTVIANSGIVADALSTIFFILGLEKSMNLLKQYEDVNVIFIDSNLNVYITHSLEYKFFPLDKVVVKVLN